MARKPDGQQHPPTSQQDEFQRLVKQAQPSLLREFWDFLRCNKKWWLLPILVTLLVLGAFILLTGTAFAPFIYTLF
jgi:hypothetical protein